MALNKGPYSSCGGHLWAKYSEVSVASRDTRQGQVWPGVGGHVCRAQTSRPQTSSVAVGYQQQPAVQCGRDSSSALPQ